MNKLNFDLNKMVKHNRDGSHGTQAERTKTLKLIANQLRVMGYKNMGATSLKTKHVNALINHWRSECSPSTGNPISIGTIKNRMSVVRWWAEKINKQNIVPRTNKELGLPDRERLPKMNKAFSLDERDTSRLPLYLRDSLRLQEEFGLRREEAAKFNPVLADQKEQVFLKSSWTKGGRERTINIVSDSQRELIDELKARYGNKSLIPQHMSYKQYLSHREHKLKENSDIKASHGLRHHFAQQRYIRLTNGMLPPRLGGPNYSQLTSEEKSIDLAARLKISFELGHKRIEITKVYLG